MNPQTNTSPNNTIAIAPPALIARMLRIAKIDNVSSRIINKIIYTHPFFIKEDVNLAKSREALFRPLAPKPVNSNSN